VALAEAFEVAAAAVAQSGWRCPPLQEERVSPCEGAPPVPDCAELVLRELLNALLWSAEAQDFDPFRLPASARAGLVAFYSPGGGAHSPAAAREWMSLVSGLPGVAYFDEALPAARSSSPPGPPPPPLPPPLPGQRDRAAPPRLRYEMRPDGGNILAAAGALLGVSTPTAGALQALWRELEPDRPLCLRREVGQDDRLLLLEGGDLKLTLVLSSGRNHAYAIHHAARPVWLRTAAEEAWRRWEPAPRGERLRPAALLAAALRAALLSPLAEASADSLDRLAPPRSREARAVQNRLLLLCSDPRSPHALAASVCRLLSPPMDDEADATLAARVVRQPLACGGASMSDGDALALARALRPMAQRGGRHAAELHAAVSAVPSLAACLAPSLPQATAWSVWFGALRASDPAVALRLGLRGLLLRCEQT